MTLLATIIKTNQLAASPSALAVMPRTSRDIPAEGLSLWDAIGGELIDATAVADMRTLLELSFTMAGNQDLDDEEWKYLFAEFTREKWTRERGAYTARYLKRKHVYPKIRSAHILDVPVPMLLPYASIIAQLREDPTIWHKVEGVEVPGIEGMLFRLPDPIGYDLPEPLISYGSGMGGAYRRLEQTKQAQLSAGQRSSNVSVEEIPERHPLMHLFEQLNAETKSWRALVITQLKKLEEADEMLRFQRAQLAQASSRIRNLEASAAVTAPIYRMARTHLNDQARLGEHWVTSPEISALPRSDLEWMLRTVAGPITGHRYVSAEHDRGLIGVPPHAIAGIVWHVRVVNRYFYPESILIVEDPFAGGALHIVELHSLAEAQESGLFDWLVSGKKEDPRDDAPAMRSAVSPGR